jgi:hypothetical protein
MSKQKKARIKSRLPKAAQGVLRSRGGAQGSPKGERGYDRLAEKRKVRNLISANKPTCKELAFLFGRGIIWIWTV